jgi:hypothetical protein
MKQFKITSQTGEISKVKAEKISDVTSSWPNAKKIEDLGEVKPLMKGMKIEEAFNNCPGEEELTNMIKALGMDKVIEIEDIDDTDFWKNDRDTLVFSMSIKVNPRFIAYAGMLAVDMAADEFNFSQHIDKYFFRLWWD